MPRNETQKPIVKKENVGDETSEAATNFKVKEEKISVGNLETNGTFWGDWDNNGGIDGNYNQSRKVIKNLTYLLF